MVCLAFERLLFAATPPVAAMILAWATLTAVGPAHAPFYQGAVLSGDTCRVFCVNVQIFAILLMLTGKQPTCKTQWV